MTSPQNQPPNLDPEPNSPRLWPTVLKVGAGLGGLALVGGTVALVWGGRLINSQLIPWVETSIEKSLDRPIDLGELEGLSFNGARLGTTVLPPTAEVATEATVAAVDMTISWPDLLFKRTLRPTLTLIEPNITVVQAADGRWLDITLPDPEEDKTQGPIKFELGKVVVQDGRASIDRDLPRPDAVAAATPILLEDLNAQAVFLSPGDQELQTVTFEADGRVGAGEFKAQGDSQLEVQAFNISLQTTDLPTTAANLFLPPTLGIAAGTLNSNLDIELRLQNKDQPGSVRGTASLRDGEILASQLTEPIRDINTTLRFQGDQVALEDTGLRVGDIPLTAAGTVGLKTGYDLTAEIPTVSVADVTDLLTATLPVAAAGDFNVKGTVTGPLDQPQLVGQLANQGPVQADQVAVETLTANFSATPELFDLQALRIIPADGGFITGQGQVELADLNNPAFQFDLQADLPGDALATTYGVALPNGAMIGSVQATGEIQGTVKDPQAQLQFRLPTSTYPGSGQLTYQNRTLVVDNTRFQVEEGTVDVEAIARLDQGNWTTNLTTANVPVERFTDQVQGLLSANLTASGRLQDFTEQTLAASGTAQIASAVVTVPPGAPPLLEPGDWNAAFRWVGNGLRIDRFTAPGVAASGFVAASLMGNAAVGPVDLDVQLDRYSLSRLEPLAPEPARSRLTLAGLASFTGQLTGPLDNLRLAGTTQLDNLALNSFAFAPRLTGPVDISLATGGTVDLRGGGDAITATLGADFLSQRFDLRQGETRAIGQLVDRQLTARVENFPIDALNLTPSPALGQAGGTLTATITADLADFNTLSAQGTATITEPALGTVVAETLEAQFSYDQDRLELTQGDLRFDNSQYRLAATVNLATPEPQYAARLDIVAGNFEDLLATLNWSTFADIGLERGVSDGAGAADLATVPASLPPPPFLNQLEAFAAFMASYDPKGDETQMALPELEELSGSFTGTVTVEGQGFSPDALVANADIQGQNWAWGNILPCDQAGTTDGGTTPASIPLEAPIDAGPDSSPPDALPDIPADGPTPVDAVGLGDRCNRFELAATYDQGSFSVNPLLFEADDTQVSFVGSGTPNDLNGELIANGVPVELAELFVELPVAVDGDLELVAQLDGSLSNPAVVGNLAVVDPSLNQQTLDSVTLDFAYKNADLSFDGAAVVAAPAAVTLTGNIPYALPFMAVQPTSEMINIEVDIRNEGLEILNLVTDDQLRWQGGQGIISLQVGGTLADPAVVGRAEFADGIVVSEALADPVTNLTGTVLFNLEQVQVNQLQANLGDGTVVAEGRLPVGAGSPPVALDPTQPNPEANGGLLVTLTQLPLDYENLIETNLEGDLVITGTALNPVVSGAVQVEKGRVAANNLLGQLGGQPNSDLEVPSPDGSTSEGSTLAAPLPQYIEDYRAQIDGFDRPVSQSPASRPGPLDRVTLNNLTLTLTDDLQIVGQPFYNIAASGDLVVNGTLQNLQPAGVITLESGWINLFSTQFRLVNDAENTATFSPEKGLDPFLNVEMVARVQDTDVTQVVATSTFTSSEISDNTGITTFGDVEFVTVYATAYGYASELQEKESASQASELLTLTSRPARSQDELLALLGSSVVTNIYGASLTQLAGFLGAGSLAGFGDRIADAIGLRSFSIFPTTDTASDSTADIGIGVEASFDIGQNVSVDALNILNSGNPPKVGLSYRFSDRLRARGTTNFSGDETLSVEYEIRF